MSWLRDAVVDCDLRVYRMLHALSLVLDFYYWLNDADAYFGLGHWYDCC